jgi:hypothetical protein
MKRWVWKYSLRSSMAPVSHLPLASLLVLTVVRDVVGFAAHKLAKVFNIAREKVVDLFSKFLEHLHIRLSQCFGVGLDGFQTGLINLESFEAVPPGLGLVLQGAC